MNPSWIVNTVIGVYASLTIVAGIADTISNGIRIPQSAMTLMALLLAASLAASGTTRHLLTAAGLVGLQATAIWIGESNGEARWSHHAVRLGITVLIAFAYWRTQSRTI